MHAITQNFIVLIFFILQIFSVNAIIERREHSFLDVFIKFQPEDDFCGARQCNLSYAISLLTAQNQFDLQSLMLQDGSMQRNEKDLGFEENTIIRVEKHLPHEDSKIFLGLRLFDVPDDIQDYLVIDVTNVIAKGRRARVRFQTDTAQIVIIVKQKTEEELFNEYAHRLLMLKQNRPDIFNKVATQNGCSCTHRNCACCEHMKVRKLHLDDTVCVNLTYISEDIGLKFSLSVDNHIYYSKEVSIRNPPPICYEVPHLRDYASLCVLLQNVELVDKHLDGCVEIEANLYHVKVAKRKIGCFKIPI
jgi:hypothetical protein